MQTSYVHRPKFNSKGLPSFPWPSFSLPRLGAVVSSLAFALGRLPSLVSGLSRRVSEAPFPSHECTSGLMARCNSLSLADRCTKRLHQLGHAGLVYFAGLMAWVLAVLFVLYKEHYFCHGARARGLHLCQCQQTAASPAAMPLAKVPTPSVSTKAAEMIAICPTAPFCLLPSFEMKNSAAHTLYSHMSHVGGAATWLLSVVSSLRSR